MAYSKGLRGKALELLKMGESSRDVSRLLGVSRHSVARWAKMVGMTFKINDYHGGIIGMERQTYTRHRPVSADLPANGKIGLPERVAIEIRVRDGWSARKISLSLALATSTITKEIHLGVNVSGGDSYLATAGHQRSLYKRSRDRLRKLVANPKLRKEVLQRLKKRHSPEQIAKRLRIDFQGEKQMQISHETIYQELYLKDSGVLFNSLKSKKILRTGRRKRKPRSRSLTRTTRKPWVVNSPICERPQEVDTRESFGQREGDLFVGRGNHSALISLIERKSRFNLLARLEGEHSSPTVIRKLVEMFNLLPQQLKLSSTWDPGVEMVRVKTFVEATGCRIYFCDPHSPW